ncbi:hypothetical protein NDU88_001095 [Pleurodeles waltl]|uniref:Uncharacterized protein n=1 Tax=Pleurodeles waltl TaxID=8319 RepID=A0AAV7NDS8_PLEWA|nr:hypothetical protein NDU88_001095 [Pleurodeles waltl]
MNGAHIARFSSRGRAAGSPSGGRAGLISRGSQMLHPAARSRFLRLLASTPLMGLLALDRGLEAALPLRRLPEAKLLSSSRAGEALGAGWADAPGVGVRHEATACEEPSCNYRAARAPRGPRMRQPHRQTSGGPAAPREARLQYSAPEATALNVCKIPITELFTPG